MAVNRVELEVTAKVDPSGLSGFEGDLDRKLVAPVRDAASKAERAFDGVGTSIVGEFQEIGPKIEREMADVGEAASGSFGGSFADLNINDIAGQLGGQLSALAGAAGPFAVAGGIAAASFGDDFMTGVSRALGSRRSEALLSIQSGLGGDALGEVGREGGAAYAAGFGESVKEVSFTAAAVRKELSQIGDAFDTGQATKEIQLLSDAFGIDLQQSINTTRRLVAQGLARDIPEALDLIVTAAQRAPATFEQNLDALEEFGSSFAAVGIKGAAAADFMADAWEQGLFPTFDRAPELIEEFNIRLAELDALRKPVEQLGLNFEEMQRKLATGRGTEALDEIVSSLIAMEDPVLRDGLALEIFGTSIESASDKLEALNLLKTIDEFDALGDAATDAADKWEDASSGMATLGRDVEEAGNFFAGATAKAADGHGILGDFGDRIDLVKRGLANIGIGDTTEKFGAFTNVVTEAEQAMADAAVQSGFLGASAQDMERGFQDAIVPVHGLDAAIGDLTGTLAQFFDFSADELLRKITQETERLGAAFQATDGDAVRFNGTIDTQARGGAALQAQFERLSSSIARAGADYEDGSIDATQFASTQAAVAQSIERVAADAGLTQAQIAGLRAKYLELPPSVVTEILAIDGASNTLAMIARMAGAIPRNILVTVSGRSINFGGFVDQFATGGVSSGGPAVVGEFGPEFIPDLRAGTQVQPRANTPEDATSGGSGITVINYVTVMGSMVSQRELIGDLTNEAVRGGFSDAFSDFGAAV